MKLYKNHIVIVNSVVLIMLGAFLQPARGEGATPPYSGCTLLPLPTSTVHYRRLECGHGATARFPANTNCGKGFGPPVPIMVCSKLDASGNPAENATRFELRCMVGLWRYDKSQPYLYRCETGSQKQPIG